MTLYSLRTADFEARRRVEEFQSVAAKICRLSITPASGDEYRSETRIGVLPGLVLADTFHSPCSALRDSELAAATGDTVLIHMPLAGGFTIRQSGGDENTLAPGALYVDPGEMPGLARFAADRSHVFYLSLPREELAAAKSGVDSSLRRAVSLTPAWRLFAAYARALHAEMAAMTVEETSVAVRHIRDLALLAFGAAGEAREQASAGGGRSARLHAVKADIERHLGSEALSPNWIAARHGIAPRTLRALFAGEQTTFRDYVAGRRLKLAHALLSDRSRDHLTISSIALAAGFGDLSWFNARFRQAYGMTPRDLRRRASGMDD